MFSKYIPLRNITQCSVKSVGSCLVWLSVAEIHGTAGDGNKGGGICGSHIEPWGHWGIDLPLRAAEVTWVDRRKELEWEHTAAAWKLRKTSNFHAAVSVELFSPLFRKQKLLGKLEVLIEHILSTKELWGRFGSKKGVKLLQKMFVSYDDEAPI